MDKSYDMELELMPDVERVAQLFTRFVFGALSTSEVLALHKWMSAAEPNRYLFLTMMQPRALVEGQLFFRQHRNDIATRRALLNRIKNQAAIPKLSEEPPYLHWWLKLATGGI